MHILFAGGGTAGHINPALAIASYIRENHPDAHISYIGTPDKLEAKLVPEAGYNFRTISVAGLVIFSPFLVTVRFISQVRTGSTVGFVADEVTEDVILEDIIFDDVTVDSVLETVEEKVELTVVLTPADVFATELVLEDVGALEDVFVVLEGLEETVGNFISVLPGV